MKKFYPFVVVLLSTIILMNVTCSEAVFYDFTGLNSTFEIVESEWNIQHGTLSTSSTGMFFGENNYPVGSKYDLEVTEASGTVVYTMTMGTDTVYNTDYGGNLTLIDLLNLPGHLMLINNSWDQALFDLGTPRLFGTHFFNLEELTDIFDSSVDSFDLSYYHIIDDLPGDPDWQITSYGAAYQEEESTGIYDYYAGITIENVGGIGTNDFWAGRYDVKIEFDLTTGALNGYHLFVDFNGTLSGADLDIFIHQQIEKEGYKMGKFRYNTNLPGFTILIAIPALSILSTIVIYFKKRKRE